MSKYITYWYKRKRESAAHPQREIEREPFCQDYRPIHSTTRPSVHDEWRASAILSLHRRLQFIPAVDAKTGELR